MNVRNHLFFLYRKENRFLIHSDYFIVRYKSSQFTTYAREKLHAFQFPDGEMLSVQYYDEK